MDSVHDLYNTAQNADPRTRWIKRSVVDDYHACLDVLAGEFNRDLKDYYVSEENFGSRYFEVTEFAGGVATVSTSQRNQEDQYKNYVQAEAYWRQLRLAVKYINRVAAQEEDPVPTQPEKLPVRTGRPTLFIGCSREGKKVAQAIQAGLPDTMEPVIWDPGVFGLSGTPIEGLEKVRGEYDFAVLVLTPDDLTTKRDQTKPSPRDNVIFELGFFIGGLGRLKTFMVYCKDDVIDLPSDLAGITAATYKRPSTPNKLEAALGVVCTRLETAMDLG